MFEDYCRVYSFVVNMEHEYIVLIRNLKQRQREIHIGVEDSHSLLIDRSWCRILANCDSYPGHRDNLRSVYNYEPSVTIAHSADA